MRYFITFACYGSHLHGDESSSVDRRHNLFGTRVLDADPGRAAAERSSMNQPPYELGSHGRTIVLEALRQVSIICRSNCSHPGSLGCDMPEPT